MALGGRAVVLGAGIAGVCAAAALRGSVDEVVIVERDELDDSSPARRGVPQAAQLHNLLGAAQQGFEALLPGFLDALVAQGASVGRVSTDTHVHELGARMPERDLGLRILSANRLLVEVVARGLLLSAENVTIRAGITATGLIMQGHSVCGVRSDVEVVEADLVVDAMGAATPVPRWLAELGTVVPTSSTPVNRWYATAVLKTVAEPAQTRFFMVFPTAPATRGGLASPIDGSHFQISLNGGPADEPPRSREAFRHYAASLEDRVIGDLLSAGELVTGPTVFRVPSTIWRRYDQCESPINALLPIGDALANLNPLFGQGMSVAAMEADALKHLAREVGVGFIGSDDLTGLYLANANAAVGRASDLGSMVDAADAWSKVFTNPVASSRFVERLAADAEAHRTYVAIWHLLEPLSALDPSVS